MDYLIVSICLIIGFILWYFYYGLECFLNGATLGRNQYTMHFSCLWEELLWVLPGGGERKAQFVRDRIGDFPRGSFAGYAYEDIRKYNRYKEVGRAVLPGLGHFILTHMILPLSPLLFYIFLVVVL